MEWVILGAFLGGTLNLGYQVYRGNISDVGDALFAFGVGAAAVAASAYTGGIAFSLAGGGGRWCGRLFGRIRTRSGRRNHFNSNHQ